MSSNNHPHTRPTLRAERLPWLMFLFLAAVFFLINYNLSFAKMKVSNYSLSVNNLTAAIAEGSLTRQIALISLTFVAILSLLRHRSNDLHRIVTKLFWAIVMTSAPVIAAFWGQNLVVGLYGPKYSAAGRTVPLLVIALAANAMAASPTCGLWAVGREDVNTKINAVSFIGALTLGPLLDLDFGVIGVAICLLATKIVVCILKWMSYAAVRAHLLKETRC